MGAAAGVGEWYTPQGLRGGATHMTSAREAVLARDGAPDPGRGNRCVHLNALWVARACARPGLLVALALACAFFAPAAASSQAEEHGGGHADAEACTEGEDGHRHACPGQLQCVGAICGDTRSGCAADEDGERLNAVWLSLV